MEITAIIQARMGSSRLKGKSLKKILDKPLLSHVIDAAKGMKLLSNIVVATGEGKEDIPILDLAGKEDVLAFAGSSENVLDRYYQAAKKFNSDLIVRITGDNPLTSSKYGDMAIENAINSKADLSSFNDLPLGTAVEIFTFPALEKAWKENFKNYHREHVTPYIKENPNLFKIKKFSSKFKNPFPTLRLTVDTPEDFLFITKIFEALYKNRPIELQEIIDYISLNQELIKINSKITQKKMTESNIK